MASTYYAMVNRLLRLVGEREYASTSVFDSSTADDHQKVQMQAKEWFSLFHQWVMVTPRCRFFLRDYTLTTASADNDYDINAATNAERILEDSMYIYGPAGSGYGPIQFMDLYEYRMQHPENDAAEGAPRRYFHHLRSAPSSVDRIGFSPPPDGVYNIRYSAFIKPYKLTTNSTEICVPEEWEHVLFFGDAMFVEIVKAEGKAPDYAAFLDAVRTEMEQHTIPLAGEHMRLDPTCDGAISIFGRRGSAEVWDW